MLCCSREESIIGSRAEFPSSAPHGRQPGVPGLLAAGTDGSHLLTAASPAEVERDKSPPQHGLSPPQRAQGRHTTASYENQSPYCSELRKC